jgi:3' exoribonuclease, RNase T-like
MRYYLDTEFDETPDRLALISLALRAQDGRELYLVSNDVNPDDCNPWVRANVWPHLAALSVSYIGPPGEFPRHIEAFVADDSGPEFWGYYSAYDWFLFCRLWGGMLLMPRRFPKVCYDLKQLADTLLPGVRFKDACPPPSTAHNALADARWNETLFNFVVDTADVQAERDDHHSPALRRGVDTFIGNARFQ